MPNDVIHITEDAVIDALKKAVVEYGADWEDPNLGSCVNVYDWDRDGGPTLVTRRCIAAEALSQLGVPDGLLLDNNDSDIRDTLEYLPPDHYHWVEGAYLLLEKAQSLQDKGTPWGQVLEDVIQYRADGMSAQEFV